MIVLYYNASLLAIFTSRTAAEDFVSRHSSDARIFQYATIPVDPLNLVVTVGGLA